MSARRQGWNLSLFITLALAAVALAGLAVLGVGEEGYRFGVRWTGRASTFLFALTFAASSAVRVWKTPSTAWLRRNRRYLGVSFAGSQAVHLLGLVGLASGSAEFRGGVTPETLVVGGLAYVFTFAMAATSSDAAVRRLGPSWHRLHRIGGWWICVVLLITVVPPMGRDPLAAFLGLCMIAAVGLRFVTGLSARAQATA